MQVASSLRQHQAERAGQVENISEVEGGDPSPLSIGYGAAWGVWWASVEVRATDSLSASAVCAAEATVASAVYHLSYSCLINSGP
jgi:hypothetical protein